MTARILRTAALLVTMSAAGVGAFGQPALAYGSFEKTCTHIRAYGPYIEALCRRVDGSWRFSRIYAPRCGGIHVSNQDGHLSCGG
jgi:hypothetical protein